MTTGLHPPAALGTALLHEVEHVSAVNHSKIIKIVFIPIAVNVEMFVKPAGVIPPPLGTELSLVLHSPSST